jgi:hypothetical protein
MRGNLGNMIDFQKRILLLLRYERQGPLRDKYIRLLHHNEQEMLRMRQAIMDEEEDVDAEFKDPLDDIPRTIDGAEGLDPEAREFRPTGAGKMAGTATRGNPKFEAQLRKAGIEPSAYLEEARRRAKIHHYPYKLLGFASDGIHKLAIPDENGRVVSFGRVGYGDHLIYSHMEKAGSVASGTADKKQSVFHKSHSKIKGDWKSNPFSANNLALKILW